MDGANVTSISIECVTESTLINVFVPDYEGTGLILQNNGGDDLSIPTGGFYQFATPVLDYTPYNVTVLSQPTNPGQTCVVENGSGTVDVLDPPDVTVLCSRNSYSLGGTVSGLQGSGLVLRNNVNLDSLSIAADGPFTFNTSRPVSGLRCGLGKRGFRGEGRF